MIQCDGCQEWYHGECVNVSPEMARRMDEKGQQYFCPNCQRSGKTANRRGGQFLTETSPSQAAAQPKQSKNIRIEAVKHMQSYLKKAIEAVRAVIKMQLEKGTNAIRPDQTEDVAPLTEADREQLDEQDKQLVILYEDEEKLKSMATTIEQSISELQGDEHEKPYRSQYRGLKGKLDAPNEHQFRLDVLLGKKPLESLGNEDVSAYPAEKKGHSA